MKKIPTWAIITLCSLLLTLSVFLTGLTGLWNVFEIPSLVTFSWQTVTISGIGTFRVPAEWNIEERDGFLFFTDRQMADGDYTVHIVGAYRGNGMLPHEVFEGVEIGRKLRSRGFHNFGDYCLTEYTVNGQVQEHFLIHLQRIIGQWEQPTLDLFVWNRDVVDEWYVRQIAHTFRRGSGEHYDGTNRGRLER